MLAYKSKYSKQVFLKNIHQIMYYRTIFYRGSNYQELWSRINVINVPMRSKHN